MQDIKFGTFADGSYGFRAAGNRILKEAKNTNFYPLGQKLLNLNSIAKERPSFIARNESFINKNKKGLGNYIWKPEALRQLLDSVKAHQIVALIDCGCQFNVTLKSQQRFLQYIDITKTNDALFMQIRPNSFGHGDFSEIAWTKRETLDHFQVSERDLREPQIQSGIIFMVKNSTTVDFVSEWQKSCELEDYRLLVSPKPRDIQHFEYLEHRWEQSILSILVKRSNFAFIPDETFWGPDWNAGLDYPIWAMRNRTGGDAYRRNLTDKWKIAVSKIL